MTLAGYLEVCGAGLMTKYQGLSQTSCWTRIEAEKAADALNACVSEGFDATFPRAPPTGPY
jgi:hypothetical protein